MNVLSKFTTKVNKQDLSSYLQLGYNKCDNPYCSFRNSLQPVDGRYNCLGPAMTTSGGSDTTTSSDHPSLQYCTGTYLVTPEQAHHVSHLFCVVETDHCKRVKRDKAAKKAARDARYRAEKLAAEVNNDLDREFSLRRTEAEERAKKGKLENVTMPETIHDVQPIKRLRKEERRLPVTVRTGLPLPSAPPNPTLNDDDDGDIPCSSTLHPLSPSSQHNLSHPPSKPVSPPLFLRRRVRSDGTSRPTGVVWDDSVLALSSCSQSIRRAQYPPVSTNGRSRSGCIDTHTNRNGKPVPKPWVSSKNGLTITHFGTLLPAAMCLPGGSDKENRVVSASGKHYLISEPKGSRP